MSMNGGQVPAGSRGRRPDRRELPHLRGRAEGRLDAHRRRGPGSRHRDRRVRASAPIERVTGRLGYATAARSGAINGVLLGLLFSAILVIGSPVRADPGVRRRAVRRHRDRDAPEHRHLLVRAPPPRLRLGHAGRRRPLRGDGRDRQHPARAAGPRAVRARDRAGATAAPPSRPRPPLPATDAAAEPPRYGERVAPTAGEAPCRPRSPIRDAREPPDAAPTKAAPSDPRRSA